MPNTFFLDGVCEFLKQWANDESVTKEQVKIWLVHVNQLDKNYRCDPRISAWTLKLLLDKDPNVTPEELTKELWLYTKSKFGASNKDILSHIAIIGLINTRRLVSMLPFLQKDVPTEYQNLFQGLNDVKELGTNQDLANDDPEQSSINVEKLYADKEKEELASTIQNPKLKEHEHLFNGEGTTKAENGARKFDLNVTPEVIENNIEEIKSVGSTGLKVVRYSLTGIVDGFNNGQFQKEFVNILEKRNFPLDLSEIKANPTKAVNFFELKNKLPTVELQDEFDEVMDLFAHAREKVLEMSTLDAARAKWEYDFEVLKDKTLPQSIGAYLHDWLVRLVPLIEKEIKEYNFARKNIESFDRQYSKNSKFSKFDYDRYKEKLQNGPFLTLLKPEKLATIVLLESLKCCATNDIYKGASVGSLVSNIGKLPNTESS
ncbi:unnamed protein product [Ambrosiozyma monospora]|uniref:Unnamed protein product n=1 Tax=Ambrosiozyma monospora TaxID=43982 RepID=A0ACB5TBM2_AMBMO|nr:unnamed protein product [Ambrosiozyma monospora]